MSHLSRLSPEQVKLFQIVTSETAPLTEVVQAAGDLLSSALPAPDVRCLVSVIYQTGKEILEQELA